MPMSLIKFIRNALIVIVITAITLEFLSFILSKSRILPFYQTPPLYLGNVGTGLDWRNENLPWGAWHKKNYVTHHHSECFDVQYQSNEIGARDNSFNSNMLYKKSYVLLGDSFAEGYGVSKEHTSERLIEKKLGINVLNFGASGSLGPLQYYLLYDKLASKYSHDGVIIYFLPDNDFNDNDYAFWQVRGIDKFANQTKRYRPYYKKDGPNEYSYFYPSEAQPIDDFDLPPSDLRSFFVNNLWTANVIRTAQMVLLKFGPQPMAWETNGKPYSGYFDAPEEEQESSIYFINKLIERIGNKNIVLVTIPIASDWAHIADGDKPKIQYWHQQLKRLEEKHENFKFIDLADYPPPAIEDLYLTCDGHWSSFGNKWTADILSNYLNKSPL